MPNPAGISGGALEDGTLAGTSSQSLAAPPDSEHEARTAGQHPVEMHLLPLVDAGWAVGAVPLLGDEVWIALDRRDPRSTAAVAAAALASWRARQPDVIEADLRRELAEDDWLIRYRIRQAGLDVHGRGSTDWPRVHDVVTARREYRQRWGVAC